MFFGVSDQLMVACGINSAIGLKTVDGVQQVPMCVAEVSLARLP